MIFVSCCAKICPCFFRQNKKRLSKTYLENLKDVQERKFSTVRKLTHDMELLEINHNKKNSYDVVEEIKEALIENNTIDPSYPISDISSPESRESLLKLEKFYENNIKNIFDTIKECIFSSYDGFDKIHEDTKNQHNLVMYMRSELNQEKNRIFTYRTEWIAPCEPEYFVKFLNDYQEQFDLSDNKMEEYYPIKTFGRNKSFSIVYLKYKKVLTYSPRDFCYLKCFQKHDQEKNIWIDCSQSISNELLPEYEDIVRGNIMLHGYYVEPITINDKKYSKVRFYSQVDFKVSIPVFVSKTFSIMEMKKYIQKSFDRIENLLKDGTFF